ncbi:MAG TPA: hypothetical protein VNO20_12110 [Solirubrobacterales bacterium]|nr:hypothetical protein [Solirubrobacterales bacterium]
MSVRDRLLLTAALPLAALAIAGCGGGDDETTESAPEATIPTTTALTKDELIEQGDAICAEVNAAIGGIGASETEVAGGTAGQVADLYVGMVESLKRLGTPAETDGYPEFSSAADALSQAEGEVKLAAERGDSTGLATAESGASTALTSFQSEAQSYGFEDCGAAPSAPVSGAAGAEAPIEEEIAPEGLEEEAEVAPEEVEPAPETGGAGSTGGGAEAGGGTEGGGTPETGGSSGGIGPG